LGCFEESRRIMPPVPTHVCLRKSIAAIEASRTQLRSLKASLDATEVAVRRSRALLAPEIPGSAVAATLDGNKAEGATANQRVAIHLLESLRAAGYDCELVQPASH
jgi:hypothetical protein